MVTVASTLEVTAPSEWLPSVMLLSGSLVLMSSPR